MIDKEKERERQKLYRLNNKEKRFETQKRYRENNKEKIKESLKKYYMENKNKMYEYSRDYIISHKDFFREYGNNRKKYKRDSDSERRTKENTYCLIRNNRIKSVSDGSINITTLLELLIKQDSKCNICGDVLNRAIINTVHLDHIQPISKGGKHIVSNVQWLCRHCNLKKGNKIY